MATEKYFVFSESGELKRMKGRIVRFLDNEDPSGSDKSAIRTSLEVSPDAAGLVQADVGTAPNEIPVNGMLGDMAYQDADSVSMGTVEAESLEVADQASIGATSGAIAAADDDAALVLQQSVGGVAELSRATDTDGHVVGKVNFANRNNSNTVNPGSANYPAVAGIEAQLETTDSNAHDDSGGHLVFKTKPEAGLIAERVRIDSSGRVGIGNSSPDYDLHVSSSTTSSSIGITGTGGSKDTWTVTSTDSGGKAVLNLANADTGTTVLQLHQDNKLVLSSGGAIDFGSGATLSDYEEGTFTPTIYYQNSSGLTISYTTQTGRYVRVGDLVSVQAYLVWTVTGTPANDNIGVSMPLAPVAARQYLQCTDSQGQSAAAEVTSLPQVAIATSSSLVGNLADNIGAGTHTIIVSGTYQTS
jgi:hypothetical protein